MKRTKQPDYLVQYANQNRKSLNLPEGLLWRELKASSQSEFKFRRQVPLLERFIADFLCPEVNLIVEVDGAQIHAAKAEDDEMRTDLLEKAGFRVLRVGAERILRCPKASAEYVLETCRLLRSNRS